MSTSTNVQLISDDTAFSDEQYHFIYPDGIGNHYWTKARNQIIEKELKKRKQVTRILEIGCGRGVVIDYLAKSGFDISGIELADSPIFPHLKGKIIVGKDVLNMPGDYCESFDTILLLDVLEHIEDPKAFLTLIKRKFKNLKTVLVTVPARQEIFSNYDEFCGHYRRYDIQTVKMHLEALNYHSTYTSYFFHALYLPARILVGFKKKRNTQLKPPSSFRMKLIHQVLTLFFRVEYNLISNRVFGSSIIAVANI